MSHKVREHNNCISRGIYRDGVLQLEVIADLNWTCQKLKKLNISHNHLRALPDNFRDLANLTVLTVSYNNLDSLPLSCCWGSVRLVSKGWRTGS